MKKDRTTSMGIALKEAGVAGWVGWERGPLKMFCAWYLFRFVVLGFLRFLQSPRRIF